jgi:hypothetical protein
MVEIDSRKASLIAEIEVSRAELRGAFRRCEANLNLASVVRRSVRRNSGAWLSASALLGLALSQIVHRKPPRTSREALSARPSDRGVAIETAGGRGAARNWLVFVSRLAFDFVKPVIVDWATEQISSLARAKSSERHPETKNSAPHS